MTVEHQATPEERAYHRLVDEQWESLSEAARAILEKANSATYCEHMIDNVILDPRDYVQIVEEMRLEAASLTDHDCDQLAKIWCSALAAAASVDPRDFETIVRRRVYPADLHKYYRMLSGMVEEVEWEKRYAEYRKRELAESEPIDDEDIPF